MPNWKLGSLATSLTADADEEDDDDDDDDAEHDADAAMIRNALRQPLPLLDAPGFTGWNCAGCWYIG